MELKEYPDIGERLYYDVLPNGLRYFFVPKPDFNKSMAFFATNYGGADRNFKLGGRWINTPAGVAHFLEHKMFDMENGENALTVLSERGASANAFTSTDMTAYHFECIDGFEENLRTLLQFVSVPYFTASSVKKEQGIIGQEIGMIEDEPDYCLYYGLLRELYKKNPMRDPVAGSVESIAEITAETLYRCHKMFYDPSNMVLVIVGRGDADDFRDIAAEILPDGIGITPARDYGGKEDGKPNGKRTVKKLPVGTPMFYAGVKAEPGLTGRRAQRYDLTAALALSTLMGRSSPLFRRLYEKSLVNDTFSYDFERTAGVSFAAFGGESRDIDAVIDEVMREAETFAKNGPDPAFFERRKKAAYGRALRALNSFDDICYNIANSVFEGSDYFETPKIVADIKIDDLRQFVADNLKMEKLAVSVVDTLGE